jgi:RNA polymerase sigma-70 factor (ECF subfamily)
MARAQDGDAESYRALLDDLGPEVLGFLRRWISEPPDVDDAYQETFIALHRARHTYQPSRPIEPWVFAIARNIAIDFARRRRARGAHEVQVAAVPERMVEGERDLRAQLEQALRRLSPRQRQAFELLQVEGLSVAEAAERAGTTTGALKVRAHRAYAALRAVFR